MHGLGGTDGITLGMFIGDTYTAWVCASRPRTAADTLEKLYRHFRNWYPEPLIATTRDEEMQNRRTLANYRRETRHERMLPPLMHFGDHLTPAAMLSMNTGLRRGEALKLRWASVDFNRRVLTVEGRNAKNRQTRHVPLNEEALSVLRRWREQSGTGMRVFNVSPDFKRLGRKFSAEPRSAIFAGTICAITLLRAWFSMVFH